MNEFPIKIDIGENNNQNIVNRNIMDEAKSTAKPEEGSLDTSARECEAQLLLNFSTTSTNQQSPTESEKFERMTLDEGTINATGRHKLPASLPCKHKYGTEGPHVIPKKMKIVQKVNKDNNQQSQTDDLLEVSVEDYELLTIIKAKGLTRQQLCRLPSRREQQSHGSDVNNNSKRQSHLQIPLVDLSCDENDGRGKPVLNHQSTSKKVALKSVETLQKEKKRNEQIVVKQVPMEKKINVTNVINEVFTKIGEKCNDSIVRVYFNKMTQTDRFACQDVAVSTVDETVMKDDKKNSKHKVKKDGVRNNVEAAHQSLPSVQFQVNEVQQMEEGLLPTQSTYDRGNYPNTTMMRPLQLSGPSHQYYNYGTTSFGARGVVHMELGSPPTAAVGSSTGTASFPLQHSSGLNVQAPTIPQHQPFVRPDSRWSLHLNQEGQPRYRRVKNTPPRSAAPSNIGPRFTPPVPGRYQTAAPEFQRLRAMALQQKQWTTQIQNYPNTAWDHSFKRSFNRSD